MFRAGRGVAYTHAINLVNTEHLPIVNAKSVRIGQKTLHVSYLTGAQWEEGIGSAHKRNGFPGFCKVSGTQTCRRVVISNQLFALCWVCYPSLIWSSVSCSSLCCFAGMSTASQLPKVSFSTNILKVRGSLTQTDLHRLHILLNCSAMCFPTRCVPGQSCWWTDCT